jgi:hypothetical protein
LDWRFLPDRVLQLKDSVRHAINASGGSAHSASLIGKTWFRFLHRAPVQALIEAGIIFVHVPRTGGTSISALLYGRNLPHVSLSFYRSLGCRRIAELPSFSIIRCPTERLISSYRFLRAGGTGLMASSRYDPLGLGACGDFDSFVERLAAHPDRIRAYDALRPQSEFVTDTDGKVIITQLFAFGDVVAGSAGLREWLGSEAIPRLNASVNHPVAISGQTADKIKQLYSDDERLYRSVLEERSAREPTATLSPSVASPEGMQRRLERSLLHVDRKRATPR